MAGRLVHSERHGKEVLYSTNDDGRALCRRYYEVRERVLSGLYDQAARSAATM